MKNDLSVLKIVSTCIVISLSFVLLAFSLIGMLTNVHAVIASPTDHLSLASLLTTPTPTTTPTSTPTATHKHKHKHTIIPPPTATTQSIAPPMILPVLTNNDSMISQDSRFPFISAALAGTLISAGVALLVSILFLRILRWRQRNKSSHGNTDNLLLMESQETLPFNDIFPPTDGTPAPTNQSQTAFNNVFLPTNGASVPTNQPQISFSDMFLPTNGASVPTHQPQTTSNGTFPSDPRNLPTHS